MNFFDPQVHARYRLLISSRLAAFSRAVSACFFPPRCLGCQMFIKPAWDLSDRTLADRISVFFCESCRQEGYQVFEPPFCDRCGQKFQSGARENHLCASCIKSPGKINRVRAALVFDGIIRSGVHRFKYLKKTGAAAFFEPLIFQAFETFFAEDDIDLIIPIPLHISRLRSRGFNQAFLLIRHFKRIYQEKYAASPGWTIDPFCLDRSRKTAPQTGFTPYQRQQNIKNAFRVTHPVKISGKRILLVDDVYTTGATATEAARTLLAAGAVSVDVLVLARA